jgi:glycosyltransferase involved in cell wall biosynthesis
VVRVVEQTLASLEASGKLEVVRILPPPKVKLRSWRQRVLPQEVAAQKLIGLHSFVSAFAWRGPGRRVHTLHELPWKHGVAENAGWRHRFWAGFGRRRADATITPTHHVARDTGGRLFGEGGKLHVVPWGVDGVFSEFPPAGVVDEVVGGRYRLPENGYALCLGANRAKKNVAAVLHGLARLIERGGPALHLVISGKDTPDLRRDLGLVSKLGLNRHVSTPGEIEEQDLPSLLRLATVVPVLSHSEGFGLPVLEALACGTPVIVPRDSAQAEVAGDAGFVVDSEDPDAVADALERARQEREELRYSLPMRSEAFRWQRTAEQIENLWESLG